MTQDSDPRPDVRTVTEAKALAALANPYRARILDALAVDGPSTASGVARRTGQAVGSASHHLKVLHEAGLVEEAPELARDRRERWWRPVSRTVRWARHEVADDVAAAEAAQAAGALNLERQIDRARQWTANAETAPEWDAAAFATASWLHLTPGELTELAGEIGELLARWRRRTQPAAPGGPGAPDGADGAEGAEGADAPDGAERETVYVFARGFPAQP